MDMIGYAPRGDLWCYRDTETDSQFLLNTIREEIRVKGTM